MGGLEFFTISSEDESAGKMTTEIERERERADGVWGSVLRISLEDEKGDKMPIRGYLGFPWLG
jgi:hypothetical protein